MRNYLENTLFSLATEWVFDVKTESNYTRIARQAARIFTYSTFQNWWNLRRLEFPIIYKNNEHWVKK